MDVKTQPSMHCKIEMKNPPANENLYNALHFYE